MATNPAAHSIGQAPFVSTRHAISRRHFLRGVGVALSLPFLDSMIAPFARSAEVASPLAPNPTPRRMFAICNNLGLLPAGFFPKGAGRDYVASPYLELLREHRNDFTVFSGVSHPNVDGGHPSDVSFLTAAPHPASSSFRNTISLDQYVAEQIGVQTRVPSLTLAVNGNRSLSCTGTGVTIPPEQSASQVFRQLFLQGTPAEVATKIRELDTGRSILDTVARQARLLQRDVTGEDRGRLEQYFTSVRDLEHRLQTSRGWESKPKPVVDATEPTDPTNPAQYMDKVKLMYDLARLAFETDSTRTITLMLNSVATPVLQIKGATITDGYHNLSHHGKAEDKLAQLKTIDEWHMRLLAGLFAELKSVREGDARLLDRAMIVYGTNLGDANSHSTTNLPVLFGGGGFRHGQHLEYDTQQNYPLPNLFVSMLQRMGLEVASFASSTGTMRGLEFS
jgi:hypothetical protein